MFKSSLLLLVAAIFGTACGIDNAFDCNAICSRYQSCFSSGYDVSACASRCRASSTGNADYTRQVNTCNACIDERSCTSATFNCAPSCGSVVP